MKNIVIILAIILISLFISSTASYQEKSQKDNITIIKILKENKNLQLEIIDLTTMLEDCRVLQIDTIEIGSAEWFPTRNEWTNMSEQEKISWEKQYNFLNN